jgi:hypothetical protein
LLAAGVVGEPAGVGRRRCIRLLAPTKSASASCSASSPRVSETCWNGNWNRRGPETWSTLPLASLCQTRREEPLWPIDSKQTSGLALAVLRAGDERRGSSTHPVRASCSGRTASQYERSTNTVEGALRHGLAVVPQRWRPSGVLLVLAPITRLHKRAARPDRIKSRRQRSASTAAIQQSPTRIGRAEWAMAAVTAMAPIACSRASPPRAS